MSSERKYSAVVGSHFDKQLAGGTANFGPDPTPMWMASLDTRTGKFPQDYSRPDHIPRRHYRAIDAPRGCSLYWDQPAVVAAHALSALTRQEKYARAADDYTRAFLNRCVAPNGVFLWGNHYYWDAFRGKTVVFAGEEDAVPVDLSSEQGGRHEVRPIAPAWETFWRVDPDATDRQIRAFVER